MIRVMSVIAALTMAPPAGDTIFPTAAVFLPQGGAVGTLRGQVHTVAHQPLIGLHDFVHTRFSYAVVPPGSSKAEALGGYTVDTYPTAREATNANTVIARALGSNDYGNVVPGQGVRLHHPLNRGPWISIAHERTLCSATTGVAYRNLQLTAYVTGQGPMGFGPTCPTQVRWALLAERFLYEAAVRYYNTHRH